MSTPKPPSDQLLSRAAELRAGGSSWDVVALKLNRSPDTVRKWSTLYAERWHALLGAAERRLITEAGTESVQILRSLMRSDDEKVRRDAARCLAGLRLELLKLEVPTSAAAAAPPHTSATLELAAFLEGHTDDQLARLAANLYPTPPHPAVPHLPEAVDGAP